MAKKATVQATLKAKIGKTVEYVGAPQGKMHSGCGIAAGSMVMITGIQNGGRCNISFNGQNYGWVYDYELKLVDDTIEELTSKILEARNAIKESEEEIVDLESKIKFMQEQNLEVLDTEGYKAYKVLKVLGLGSYAQAMEIVKILG